MDRKFLRVPVVIFVLAFITAVFVLIPLLFLVNSLNEKLDKIDTALYVIESANKPVLTPSSSSPSASPSGEVR